VDEIVLSLSAKGLTTGEIAAHFADVFGARVSKDTISRITENVIGEMTEWQNRPLDRVFRWCSSTRSFVKVRDGQVTNRPVYVAIGVSVNGERDILGLWAGDGGEGAKFWLSGPSLMWMNFTRSPSSVRMSTGPWPPTATQYVSTSRTTAGSSRLAKYSSAVRPSIMDSSSQAWLW
jgi:hypothetical protein